MKKEGNSGEKNLIDLVDDFVGKFKKLLEKGNKYDKLATAKIVKAVQTSADGIKLAVNAAEEDAKKTEAEIEKVMAE